VAAIQLEIFEDQEDALGEGLEITTEGEFVVVKVRIWEEGVGSFGLAELKIHYPVARKIGVAGVSAAREVSDS